MIPEIEYAIAWSNGTLTSFGVGFLSGSFAFDHLEISTSEPGDLRGKVVSRTITKSDWSEVTDNPVCRINWKEEGLE